MPVCLYLYNITFFHVQNCILIYACTCCIFATIYIYIYFFFNEFFFFFFASFCTIFFFLTMAYLKIAYLILREKLDTIARIRSIVCYVLNICIHRKINRLFSFYFRSIDLFIYACYYFYLYVTITRCEFRVRNVRASKN